MLAIVNLPALWTGDFYTQDLTRDETLPQYWTDAIAALDAQSHDTRVLEIPGADFAAYRWGQTVDPITPGLMDRPYVARELVPWGSAASADLLNALDQRIQEGTLDPDALAPIARSDGERRDRLPGRPADRPLQPGPRRSRCGSSSPTRSRRLGDPTSASAPASVRRCTTRSTTRSSSRCPRMRRIRRR